MLKQFTVEPLTPREQEITRLVAQGMVNKDIARSLYITLGTTKSHIRNIMVKTGLTRLELAVEYHKEIERENQKLQKKWDESLVQSLIVKPMICDEETGCVFDAITVEACNQEDGTRLWGIFKGQQYAMSKLDGQFCWIPPSNRPKNYKEMFRWDSAQSAFDFAKQAIGDLEQRERAKVSAYKTILKSREMVEAK